MRRRDQSGEPSLRLARRDFLRTGAVVSLSVATAGHLGPGRALAGSLAADEPLDMQRGACELVVQPVFMYTIPKRVEGRSWRGWGGIQTEEAAAEETTCIEGELKQLCESAGFKLKMLPLAKVSHAEQAAALKETGADVTLVFAAGGGTNVLNAVAETTKWTVVFVRRTKGPYYLWDEIVHSRFLRAHSDHVQHATVNLQDVVVDEPQDILWRLRSLYGLKNTIGRRIICVGGPGGWACPQAPDLARERFGIDMITVTIPEMNAIIEKARQNGDLMAQCRQAAKDYIDADNVTLATTEEHVAGSFLLKKLFHDLMEKSDAYAVTTRGCMGSYAGIMPCLTLTLVNDDGYMAYCEGDFVVIPSHILSHFISGKPTYFCNPTFPHKGRMMFAHCTAPRRMSGDHLEPVELVTHYESDHGAATHVHFPEGQQLTIVKPDFEAKNWLAMTGTIKGHPFIDTCRAQVEVELNADTQQVMKNLRGFHCMLAYGDHTQQIAYAAKKVGINVQVLQG
jgi:L-fucose isomerase-like protein